MAAILKKNTLYSFFFQKWDCFIPTAFVKKKLEKILCSSREYYRIKVYRICQSNGGHFEKNPLYPLLEFQEKGCVFQTDFVKQTWRAYRLSLVFYPRPIEEWFSLSHDEMSQSPPPCSCYLN